MDFMKLFGTVVAVFFHPGSASKINGQRICRRGTERPCYKVSYIQDSRRRLTFEDAGRACRSDGGQLLSIETESEQRLVERFIRQLQAADGDFWIGLRRSPQRLRPDTSSPGCPSQYYWLDGSRAKFRNWHWDEPSCGGEMCVVLYYQPSAPPDEEGHFLFQWNDDNCNSKNNYVCKYAEENVPAFTEDGNRERAAPTGGPAPFSTTQSDGRMGLESSVSLSDDTLYASYILYAAIPALLLLLLAAAGFFCYKRHAKRKKTEAAGKSCRAKPWMVAAASPGPVQGPYAFSDVTKLPPTTSALADIMRAYSCAADDYENVPGADRATDSVSNDIYEMCRAQSHSGWVENEIYG